MKRHAFFKSGLIVLATSLAACDSPLNQVNLMHFASSTSVSQSTASISGGNSMVVINGDMLRVAGGMLSVNGVSYGRVNQADRIEYSVQNGKKRLLVNGVARAPVSTS